MPILSFSVAWPQERFAPGVINGGFIQIKWANFCFLTFVRKRETSGKLHDLPNSGLGPHSVF